MTLELIGRVAGGSDLTQTEMTDAIDAIMTGQWPDEQIAIFLTALHHKGESAAELAGAASALRRHMTSIRTTHPLVLDTCGTGGDGSGTFNVSTAAAIVTAGAGVPVAKHGNRSITSKTGSADVLAEMGVNINASVEQCERCLAEVGLCFCFAPSLHPAMRHVASVRRQLGIRTIFNLIGPLCNPAQATYQLLGVGQPVLRPRLATALKLLGAKSAVVVTGQDGLDEVTLTGPTDCTHIQDHEIQEFRWVPEDFGVTRVSTLATVAVAGHVESAAMIQDVLAGTRGTARDLVLVNSAAALWTAGRGTLSECVAQAEQSIDSGTARRILERLVTVSRTA